MSLLQFVNVILLTIVGIKDFVFFLGGSIGALYYYWINLLIFTQFIKTNIAYSVL